MNGKRLSNIKHIDFVLLDLICIEVSFFVAYYIRLGDIRYIPDDYNAL